MEDAHALADAGQRGMPLLWCEYFEPAGWNCDDRRALLVNALSEHYSHPSQDALWRSLQLARDGSTVLQLDAMRLDPLVLAAMDEDPGSALACLSIAVNEAWPEVHARLREVMGTSIMAPRITPRLVNWPSRKIGIRQLKSSTIGQLVAIHGTVVRMSPVRPMVQQMHFICGKCATRITQVFEDGKYMPPAHCTTGGCRSRSFEPCRSDAKCVDWQKLRVQEIMGTDKQQEGQVPRSVEVELTSDLVGSAVVGDVVTVMGWVKVLATGDDLGQFGSVGAGIPGGGGKSKGGGGKQQSLFLIYMDATSVHNVSKSSRSASDKAANAGSSHTSQTQPSVIASAGVGMPPNMPNFTLKDLDFIVKFSQDCEGDQFRQLVHALCPSIYGQEMVKAGLLLALMGGVRKNEGMPGRVNIRGDIHLLLVGDPGLGKSQLLQAAANAAPRGLYVCGKTSTGCGLTVSIAKDAVTGDYVFEAGAVVLGDRGVCCVDEFDKMQNEHQSLLEAMEQQSVSVAKAGLVASLPARTAIMAAANPVEGHYNRAKLISENLKMSPAMLSRFDMIFILLDKPDENLDMALSEHVLAMHSGSAVRADNARKRLLEAGPSEAPLLITRTPEAEGQAARQPLLQRLRSYRGNDQDSILPTVLVRKYIAYAREFCTPVLSEEAKETLQAFYLQLRQQVAPGASNPITARQLESLARLAEARARVELRQVVTRDDAEDVIEIMREALYDKFGGMDDLGAGCVDFRKTGPGSRPGSKAAEMQRFLTKLAAVAKRKGQNAFTRGELRVVGTEINLQVADIGAFIDQLNDAGELLVCGPGTYKVNAAIDVGAPAPAGSSQIMPGAGAPSQRAAFSQRPPSFGSYGDGMEGPFSLGPGSLASASQGSRPAFGRGRAGGRGGLTGGRGSSTLRGGRAGRGRTSQLFAAPGSIPVGEDFGMEGPSSQFW